MHFFYIILTSLFVVSGCSSIQVVSDVDTAEKKIADSVVNTVAIITEINKAIQKSPPAGGNINNKWVDTDIFHSVIIDRKTKEVLVSGRNNFNQLGAGFAESDTEFMPLGVKALSINAVARRTYIMGFDGRLWVQGLNITNFVQIPVDNIIDFAGGFPYTYILDNIGDVYRWQANRPDKIVKVDFPSSIVALDGDLYHHIFLTADGDVFGLGLNHSGQLGLGHSNPVQSPVQLPVNNINEISVSPFNTVLTDHNGLVFIAGRTPYLPESTYSKSFVNLNVAKGLVKGFAGIDNTILLYQDNTVEVIGWYNSKMYTEFTTLPILNVKFMDISGGRSVFILKNDDIYPN